jgi:hypothetical protein
MAAVGVLRALGLTKAEALDLVREAGSDPETPAQLEMALSVQPEHL